KASNAAVFDIKAITDFIYRAAQQNKFVPFVLPTPGAILGKKLTLCIPILGGECQLVFTPEGNVRINRLPAHLDLTIETPGSIKTGADLLCGTVCLSGKHILNAHSLIAETLVVKTDQAPALTAQSAAQKQPHYSFHNRGHIAITKGDFTFNGEGFSHTAGTVTTNQNIVLTAININLVAQTVAGQNITLHQGGGICVVSDAVKAAGELGFYLPEGMTITEARTVPGSLRYILSHSATKPLVFLANQTAESGHLSINTPTPLIIGDNEHSVTLKSSQYLQLEGQRLDLHKGRLLSVKGLQLRAIRDIVLGREEAAQAAILCLGPVEMDANDISWNQLEMMCGGDFHAKGNGNLINTSSQIHIKGNAIWAMPTRHQLLVKEEIQIIPGKKPFFSRIIPPPTTVKTGAQALTKPSTVIIEGKLSIGSHELDIFASQISCCTFDGVEPKSLKDKSFTPFTTVMVRHKTGEDRIKHKFHSDDVHEKFAYFPTVVLGAPINASFSVGSDFKASIPKLEISGIFAAISAEINGIQQGLIGQFNACVSLAPMVFKPFKEQVSLLNYFDPTLLYEISLGGETVFKSVLAPPLRHFMPRLPRMFLSADGTLTPSPDNLRRLLPREKEEQLLTKVMLGEFGRGFLTREANTPQRMMQYFETNAIRYSQSTQKLMTTQSSGLVLQQTANNALSVVQPNFVGEALALSEPCIVDTIETIVFEDGHTEAVLVPTAFFPKHFDNRRLRDGAACLFALENITLSGVPGSALHVRGNFEGEKIVIQGLETLTCTRNTYTRSETVTHESKHRNLLGKNETTVSFQQVAITELQPGNEMVARRGARFLNVNNIYLSGAKDQLGPEGLVVENADTFVDAAIVRNKIGTTVSANQKGFLGIGGSSTSVTPVLQEAIGSDIATEGPISIQARYGQFDATQFRVTEGEVPKFEFEISELHFHELLHAVEANNRASEALLLSELKAQVRTAKRKSRQSTTLLLISIPVCCYTSGLIRGYLEQVMGITLSAIVVNGVVMAEATATAAQTAAIVGLSGMGAGLVGAAIQGQPLAKAALNGAVFSLLGHGIANAPVLAASSQLVKDVASGVVVGSTSAALNHGNIVESALMGGAASGVAATVVPGWEKSLSVVKSATKGMVRSGVAVALNGGSANNLVADLANAAMGATVGQKMSGLGCQHGQELGVSAVVSPSPLPARRSELNVAHQRTRGLLFDAEMERSFNDTTRGFGRMRTEDNFFGTNADLFDTQPVLLWCAPNRFNRTNVSEALQEVKPLQVVQNFGRGVKDSVVETGQFIGEEIARLRLGERTKIGSLVKATGIFLGEEAARVTLYEQTQVEQFTRVVGTFVGEEAARVQLGEKTKTEVLVFSKVQKLSQMSAEELAYHLGRGVGDIFTGYGVTQGLKLGCKVANVGLDNVLVGSKAEFLNPHPKPLSLTQGGFISIGGVTLDGLKKQDFALAQVLNTAQRGIGSIQVHSVTDAMRLNTELALKQANILCAKGELTSHALSDIKTLTAGVKLNNPKVIQELTRDGSKMADWAKYTTREAVTLSNGQKVQVHFYKNDITGKVNKSIDCKITPAVLPVRVYKRKQ
ncbi:MAG TPA: hypothetical protein VGU44_01595, partial [Gammaproteobacteria bacterium]|nr:hypothetical protein [Gammaproteobacteria bacterium]